MKIIKVLLILFCFISITKAQVDSTEIKLLTSIVEEKQKELEEIGKKISEMEITINKLKGAYEKTQYDIYLFTERKKKLIENKIDREK